MIVFATYNVDPAMFPGAEFIYYDVSKAALVNDAFKKGDSSDLLESWAERFKNGKGDGGVPLIAEMVVRMHETQLNKIDVFVLDIGALDGDIFGQALYVYAEQTQKNWSDGVRHVNPLAS